MVVATTSIQLGGPGRPAVLRRGSVEEAHRQQSCSVAAAQTPASTARTMSAHRLGGSQAGLLPAERTTGGYRVYDEAAIERLGFISSAKHLGLPLEEIAELLGVWASGACRDVKADLRPRVMARIADAQERAAELAAFTAVLHRALEHLDALPDRLDRCDPQCAFLAQDVQEPPLRRRSLPRSRLPRWSRSGGVPRRWPAP